MMIHDFQRFQVDLPLKKKLLTKKMTHHQWNSCIRLIIMKNMSVHEANACEWGALCHLKCALCDMNIKIYKLLSNYICSSEIFSLFHPVWIFCYTRQLIPCIQSVLHRRHSLRTANSLESKQFQQLRSNDIPLITIVSSPRPRRKLEKK